MNSRLGFDLLPDLQALEAPPAVVVQLHVEEPDRSGYVRYVTSRFGNIVDAFSVSTEHLARGGRGLRRAGLEDPRDPHRRGRRGGVLPGPRRAGGRARATGFHVLYPGRLADQKDPLLMIEVAARLRGAAEST